MTIHIVLDRHPITEKETLLVGDRPVHEIIENLTKEDWFDRLDADAEVHTFCTYSNLVLDIYTSFRASTLPAHTPLEEVYRNIFIHDHSTGEDLPFVGAVHKVVQVDAVAAAPPTA